MKNTSKSATFLASASALALILATSAFADERPRNETWRDSDRAGDRRAEQRDDRHDQASRDANRDTYRNNDARNNNDRRQGEGYRAPQARDNRGSQSRTREAYRNGVARSDGRITMQGRINRYERDRGGYRVWFGGNPYSYWVPESYFHGRRISVGLDIRLGGIFRNGGVVVDVLGWPGDPYYNDPYYNDGYYNDGYYGSGYDNGFVRGIVDRVDRRDSTIVLRDQASGRYVTVDMRGVDYRRSRLDTNDLRPGDRVTLAGSWVRGNIFAANRIDSVSSY